MLKIDGNNIYLTRGNTATFELTVKDSEGNDYDFSDDSVVFTLKKHCSDPVAIVSKPFVDGKINFEEKDTNNLEFGDYWYDVELRHTETDPETGEETVNVDTIIVPHNFTVGRECTW